MFIVFSRIREPSGLTSTKIFAAIRSRENIWKKTNSPVDTSVKRGASDVPSNMYSTKLQIIRETYIMLDRIDLIVQEPQERDWYPRLRCLAMSDTILKAC